MAPSESRQKVMKMLGEYGCYFLSLVHLAENITEKRIDAVEQYLEALNKKLSGYDIFCEDIAEICYSDYTVGEETSRKEAMENITAAMSGIKSRIMLDSTNLYLLRFALGIVNIPVSCSQYVYETDSVPFVQMVLRGSVDYYAPYSNQGFYSDASVLKMIEYGAWPSFMLMAADNFELYNTPLENYFSLNYDNWKERISSDFQKKYYANLSSDNPTALNMPEIIKMALQAKIDMQIVNSRNSDAKRQELYKKYQPILNELQKYADILKEPELENYDC